MEVSATLRMEARNWSLENKWAARNVAMDSGSTDAALMVHAVVLVTSNWIGRAAPVSWA